MQISEEKVEKYIEIYFKKYGVRIDKTQARTELTSLVCLMEAVYQHTNKQDNDRDLQSRK